MGSKITSEQRMQLKTSIRIGCSIEEIINEYPLSFQELICEIKRYVDEYNLRGLVSRVPIENNRLLVLKDIPLETGNLYALKVIYEYARNNKIYDVINLGNVLGNNGKTLDEQIAFVKDVYPKIDKLTTHFLLGNVDYELLRKMILPFEHFLIRDDLDVLGYKRFYLRWLKELITITNVNRKCHLDIPKISTRINVGDVSLNTSDINIEPVSMDDNKFLVLSKDDEFLCVDTYQVFGNNVRRSDVMIKELKKGGK